VNHKPTYHFADDRAIEAEGLWLEDDQDLKPLAAELLDLLPCQVDWLIDDSSIWRTISDRWHHNFVETLKRRDSNSLSAALSKLHDLPLLKGIDQSESESRRFRDSPEARWRFLVDSKSLLCRLTEALGILEDVGGFRRLYRFPFWLRNGYVEELYAIQGT